MEIVPSQVTDELTPEEIQYSADHGAHRTLGNHQYAAISVLGPQQCGQRNEKFCINILSTAATVEELDVYIKDICANGYRAFDVYVVSMNKFLILPPPREIQDRKYMQDDLKAFFKQHTDEVVQSQHRVLQRMTGVNTVEPLPVPVPVPAATASTTETPVEPGDAIGQPLEIKQ